MADSDQTPPPVAAPWYTSKVLQGILTIIITQLIAKVTALWHIDFALFGLDVNSIVAWLMNGISAAAALYVTHARITQKTAPVITGSKTTADEINAVNSPAPVPAPIVQPEKKP